MGLSLGYRFKKRSHLAQLTFAQAQKARRDYAAKKYNQAELAKRLNLSQAAVSMLLRGVTYKMRTFSNDVG